MKKEKLELLLNKLSSTYSSIIIKFILLNDERLLNLLVKFDNKLFDEAIKIIVVPNIDVEYKIEALKLLKNIKFKNDFNISYACNILKEPIAIREEYALVGAKILATTSTMFSTQTTYDILFNENARKKHINVEGAKILSQTSEEYKAYYISLLLKDPTIAEDIAIKGSKIINQSTSMDNAKEAYEEIIVIQNNNIESGLKKAKRKSVRVDHLRTVNIEFLKENGFIDALNKYREGENIKPSDLLNDIDPQFEMNFSKFNKTFRKK